MPAAVKNGYTLLVNAGDLRFTAQDDGGRVAEVTVLAVFYSARDKELGQHAAELKQRLEASDVVGLGSKVGLAFPVAVPMGTARVRFVARGCGDGGAGVGERGAVERCAAAV